MSDFVLRSFVFFRFAAPPLLLHACRLYIAGLKSRYFFCPNYVARRRISASVVQRVWKCTCVLLDLLANPCRGRAPFCTHAISTSVTKNMFMERQTIVNTDRKSTRLNSSH